MHKKKFKLICCFAPIFVIGSAIIGLWIKLFFFTGRAYRALLDINYVSKNDNYPIDLVYLWCDDNPQRERVRNKLKRKLGIVDIKEEHLRGATAKARFISNDELKYSLRSVEKYAPWIRNIYIVTDNQVPNWLNTKHPKIKIVDHKEIMPASARPNFNSAAIEFTIVNIPDLSEHFLYANDDTLFTNKVEPGDFFKDGKPIYVLRHTLSDKITKSNYGITIDNSYNAVKTKFGDNPWLRRYPHHNIDPYTKTDILNTNKEFKEEIEETINSHFRSNENLQRQIYAYYSILSGNGYYKVQTKEVLYNWKSKIAEKPLKISDIYSIHFICLNSYIGKNIKMLCTNDDEFTTDLDRLKYKMVMEQIFPDKSAFEK